MKFDEYKNLCISIADEMYKFDEPQNYAKDKITILYEKANEIKNRMIEFNYDGNNISHFIANIDKIKKFSTGGYHISIRHKHGEIKNKYLITNILKECKRFNFVSKTTYDAFEFTKQDESIIDEIIPSNKRLILGISKDELIYLIDYLHRFKENSIFY